LIVDSESTLTQKLALSFGIRLVEVVRILLGAMCFDAGQ